MVKTLMEMRRLLRYVVMLFVVIFVAACSVTRSIPEGSYLLSRVDIEADDETPRAERITEERDDLLKRVRIHLMRALDNTLNNHTVQAHCILQERFFHYHAQSNWGHFPRTLP